MGEAERQDAIRVENVECRYGEKVILRDISFTVKCNEIFFITGRSGCGKSTLLRHLVGLRQPAQGRISYFGMELNNPDPRKRQESSKSLGVLFQKSALWTDLTLAENIHLPLIRHTKLPEKIRNEIVALKLAQVGLAGYQDYFPSELSGGMQKRAALARALALDPSILFFDEPTSSLDPITARQIDQLIFHVRQTVGATIVVVSHSVPSILSIADRMLLLDSETRGIVALGKPEEIAKSGENGLAREFFRPETRELDQSEVDKMMIL